MNGSKSNKYFAFISYKREDEEWAIWFHHELENYHLPATLNGRADLPIEFRPVFRDVDELKAGNLPEQIYNALASSAYLVVICSPNAAKSEWVNKEIRDFIETGKTKGVDNVRNIFPFIVEGHPHAQIESEECFPKVLLDLAKDQERIGGNVNESGRDKAFVKVLAGMLNDVALDELWNRYERDKAEEERKKREERDKLLISQSRFIAEKANRLIEEGDSYLVQRLLLDVLPKHLDKPDRPYTVEAEAALRKALNDNSAILKGHTYVVSSVAFSPDDKKIVSTGWDCSSFVWDVSSGIGTKLSETTGTHASGESCYSPDGKYILTAGFDVKIFDSETLQLITTLDVKGFLIESATYSPDGNKVFVSTNDNTQVFDAKSYQLLYTLDVQVGKLTVYSFSPDGKRLCCLKKYGDSHACIIDTDSGNILVPINEDYINSMAFSPDGESVVTSSWNGKAKVWDAHTGVLINEINVSNTVVNDAEFSPDGKHIATASWDGVVRLWDVEDVKNEKLEKEYFGHQGRVLSLAFSNDGSRLISSSWDNTIRMWDISDADPDISEVEAYYDRKIFTSPVGQKIALVNWGKPVKVLSLETGDVLYELPEDTWQVHTVDFSPDGKTLVTASQDHTVRIWDADNGQELNSFAHNSIVYSAAFCPDGIHVASGTDIPDRKIRIWNTLTGQLELIIDLPHGIYSLTYSPDGSYLACLLEDQTLHIFNVNRGTELIEYNIPTSVHDKSDVRFDGSNIIVSSDGYQITYDFPPLQELIDQTRERFKDRPLTPEERKQFYLE